MSRAPFLPFLCCSIFLVALCAQPALAIGISPPSVKMDYVPGQVYQIPIKLTNYNNFPINIETRTDGEFGSAFSVEQPLTIPAGDSLQTTVSVRAPAAFERPGMHVTYIFFKEVFVDRARGSFAVKTEVGMKVMLWQPYPGNYAEVTASAPNVGAGNDTVLKVVVNNLGTAPIEDGKATVRVVSGQGALRDVFIFPGIAIAGNSNQEFFDTIPSRSYPPGRYTLETTLNYGVNVSTMNGSFIVGTQDVDIISMEDPIYLDKPVNKIRINLQSLWNLPLENVHATFTLGGNPAQTPPISLQPFGRGSLEGYWETDRAVQPGIQMAQVVVTFGTGQQKEALLPVTVFNETPPEPAFIDPTLEEPTVELGTTDLLFIGVALILVICLVLFAAAKWRKKEPPVAPPVDPALPPSGGA